MFCSNCGCRIPAKASKCPNCNTTVEEMEYCSGFWSELNQNSVLHIDEYQKNTDCKVENDIDQEAQGEVETLKPQVGINSLKNKNKFPFIKYAVIAEGVIIVILLLYNSISGALLKHKLNESNEQNSMLKEQINSLNSEYDSLKQQSDSKDIDYDSAIVEWEQKYKELKNNYDVIQNENETLKEELNGLKNQEQEQTAGVDDNVNNNGVMNNETQVPGGQTPSEQTPQTNPFQYTNPLVDPQSDSSNIFK